MKRYCEKEIKVETAYWGNKNLIIHDVALAYPNFELSFELFIITSEYQFGAVIVQSHRTISFLTGKNSTQQQYTIT